MSQELRQNLVAKMNNALELKRHIVGVRFIKNEEEFAACKSQPVVYRMPYCVMVKSASVGHALKARPDNMGCFGAARALGMREIPDSYLSGEDYMKLGIFNDQAVSKRVVDNIAICPNNPYGIEVAALELMEEEPDVVIIVSMPYNVMRVIQGYNYYNGTYSNYRIGGLQAMCAEATAYPYTSGNINVTMMCAGTRMLCKWDRSELAVAMPYNKFETTVEGILKTIDPLERDGDKARIENNLANAGLEPIEIHYGKNYDTKHYLFGKNGLV